MYSIRRTEIKTTDVLAYVINQMLNSTVKKIKPIPVLFCDDVLPSKKYETKNGVANASQIAKNAGSVHVPRI